MQHVRNSADMKPLDLIVRCMTWRDGDLWIAASIDLGLAAQGHTCDEARDALHAQISSYVRDAMTRDAAHADVLLERKAPFVDQLRFAFWRWVANRPRLRASVKRMIDRIGLGIRNKSAYMQPLPLIAA